MKPMSRRLFAVAAAVLLTSPAAAGVTAGIGQTTGNNNYEATRLDASLDLGDSMVLSPSYTRYRADYTNGTYQNFALRAGWVQGPASIGVQGSALPRVDGYERTSAGADLTISLQPGGSHHGRRMAGPDSGYSQSSGSGLGAADVGVSATEIIHSDEKDGTGATRSTAFTVGQTDLSAFAGVKFLLTVLSAQLTKSTYTKTLNNQSPPVRPAPYLDLVGVGAISVGYPDFSYNLRASFKAAPIVEPYLSYTHTTYELGMNPSNAVEAGVKVGLQMLSLRGAYEHFEETGLPDHNYVTVGAALNFGD